MLVVRTLTFAVVVPGTVAVAVPLLLVAPNLELATYELEPLAFAGIVPIVPGVAIVAWCASDFVLAGRGTPLPLDPPKALVSRGLYRVVRNPMYVGVALVLAGEALLMESLSLWLYTALVWVGFHSFVVLYEEPSLKRRFGPAYEEYREAVPRWIPRIGEGSHARTGLTGGCVGR
jgi:protein-S-isoprenylcysteine O-methyltransferase Ste14